MGDSADFARMMLSKKRAKPILNSRRASDRPMLPGERARVSVASTFAALESKPRKHEGLLSRVFHAPARAVDDLVDLPFERDRSSGGMAGLKKAVDVSGQASKEYFGGQAAAFDPRPLAHPVKLVKDTVATAKTIKNDPAGMAKAMLSDPAFFGSLVGGAALGSLAPETAATKLRMPVRDPGHNPLAKDMTRLKPKIPVGKGFHLERALATDEGNPRYITYTGEEQPLNPFYGNTAIYNLMGPGPKRGLLRRRKPDAIYGSITGKPMPGRPLPFSGQSERTPIGEIYVSDQARKALGPFKGAESMVDAMYQAGGQRPLTSDFANQQLAKFAKLSTKRGKPWFQGVSDREFAEMGLMSDPEARWLYEPTGDPNDPLNWTFDPGDFVDMETGDLHDGIYPEDLPAPLHRAVFGTNPVKGDRGFGGTRGAGFDYSPDTVLYPRQQKLAQALLRKRG